MVVSVVDVTCVWTGACVEKRKETWHWNDVVNVTIKETKEAFKS